MAFCIHCGFQNSPEASFCQLCGKALASDASPVTQPPAAVPPPAPPPRRKSGSNVWAVGCLICGVIFFVGLCAANLGGDNSSGPVSGRIPAASVPPKQTKEVIKVTAEALAKEYSDNAVAADEKYEGKRLQVTGTIRDIGKDVMDTAYVVLKGGGQYELNDIQCMFREEHERAIATLKKGQKVTIEGETAGEALGLNVILRYCELKP